MQKFFLSIILLSFLLAGKLLLPPPILAQEYFFQEEFNQERPTNTLDSSKWTVYPNAFTTDAVTVKETGGNLTTWQQVNTKQFPYIVSKINPFPSGDWSMEIGFQYTWVTAWGTGIALAEQAPANGGGFNALFAIQVWQDNSFGPNMRVQFGGASADTVIYTIPTNTASHIIRIDRIGQKYLLYLDGILIFTSTDTSKEAKAMWMGNPTIQNPPVPDWTRFNVDYIRVKSLASAPTPFLDLPWDYEGKGMSFNEAALAINSYIDHTYPFLSVGKDLAEPTNYINQITAFNPDIPNNRPYSSHDGYDYGKPAKVNISDSVLAAADGEATYHYDSSTIGNAIYIDHGNGYQTRYFHMLDNSTIVKDNSKVWVSRGQEIGKVGATGHVIPGGEAGAHIHFMVVQDKNKDGSFDDNIPDGITDPFGWQSKDPDPWPNYSFYYNSLQRTGNTSFYLWKNKLDNLDTSLTSNGGVYNVGRYTLNFPNGLTDQTLGLRIDSSPNVQPSNSLSSIGSTIVATATDNLGNIVAQFQALYTLTVDFSPFDLSRFKTDTISFYSSSDGVNWTKEPTTVDLVNKTATTQVNHMTYFALMGERADTTSPTTTASLAGEQGLTNWFKSDVTLTLNAQDNEGGLGVDYTMYRVDEGEWQQYIAPFNVTSEGHHKIEFYSADKDENLEAIQSIEFDIDKTPPEVKIAINPSLKDLVVRGADQNTVVVNTQNPNLYLLRDKAGNSLKMIVRDFDRTKVDLFRIYSLQYNAKPPILVDANSYNVIYPLWEQNFILKDEVKIRIKFNPLNNQSTITTKQAGAEIVKETRDGLVLLQLSTNQGKLEYSY